MSDYIDIVFDGPPGPTARRFLEVEDGIGKSIRIGEWLQRDDGYWVLRLDAPDIVSDLKRQLEHEKRERALATTREVQAKYKLSEERTRADALAVALRKAVNIIEAAYEEIDEDGTRMVEYTVAEDHSMMLSVLNEHRQSRRIKRTSPIAGEGMMKNLLIANLGWTGFWGAGIVSILLPGTTLPVINLVTLVGCFFIFISSLRKWSREKGNE